MKKVLSSFLIFMLLFEMLTPIFATEIIIDGGNNEVPVELTQAITSFSVTVPTVLPVDLDANGVVTVATDNRIINNSWGPVEVKGVSLTPLNDWVLVDFTTDFKNKKVGLKEFGFELNNSPVLTDGSCEATFDVIPGNSEINFSYDANVATQRQALEDQQIAYVVFTIGWANSNINAIPVTSIDSSGNNLNATSTNIVGSQKEELLNSLDVSGLADSNEVDYLINVESDNFDGMADTTFDMKGLANEGDTVVILHYDETLEKWEYISTEIVNSDGKINADFSSYSPVAFIINGIAIPIYDSTFAHNSWEDIIIACQTNQVPSTWSVGDTKSMTIGDRDYDIVIIGKNHDVYSDGSGIAPLTFQLKDCWKDKTTMDGLSSNNTNYYQWSGSYMRNTKLPSILAEMPVEVQNGIRTVTKYTSGDSSTADKLFLLSEYEVFGSVKFSRNSGQDKLYDYYKIAANRCKKVNGVASGWWERNPRWDTANTYCVVLSNGVQDWASSIAQGISFAFCF